MMDWSSFWFGWAGASFLSIGVNWLSNKKHKKDVANYFEVVMDDLPKAMAKEGIMYVTSDEASKIKLSRANVRETIQ